MLSSVTKHDPHMPLEPNSVHGAGMAEMQYTTLKATQVKGTGVSFLMPQLLLLTPPGVFHNTNEGLFKWKKDDCISRW